MIVLDASAVIELLLNTPAAEAVAERVFEPAGALAAPELLDVEVPQVLRRYARSGELAADHGHEALDDLADLPITRHPHGPLLERVWELRGHLTAYDAVYVALAEALAATLLTRDDRLAAAPGHGASVEIV